MAFRYELGSSTLPFGAFRKSSLNKPKTPALIPIRPPTSCRIRAPENGNEGHNPEDETKRPQFNFLSIPATLTIIYASLPQSVAAATKVSEKKRSAKKALETLTPEQLKSWSKGLPLVTDRIPYTDIVELKKLGKLKHVIKPPGVSLRRRVEPVLVVLEDSRVLRTVLPSVDGNRKFWDTWDQLSIDSACVNAYTPPVKRPDVPAPYLGFLWSVPGFMLKLMKPKKESKKESKRVMELRRVREEFRRQRKEDLDRMREEREMIEKAIRMQKKEEKRRMKREIRKRKYEESLREARKNYQHMAIVWANLARDSNVATALGLVFFVIFYRTVVFSYRRQQKDYEDRLKIEKAEAEEKKKMRELERELEGIEAGDEEIEGGAGGEQNPYMKMAMQFMKSGARVRRAHNKRLPQYLERGVDVKFSDVAGLGKIRLELEEIVKFFTHGEMYRRRGVKIPGYFLKDLQ